MACANKNLIGAGILDEGITDPEKWKERFIADLASVGQSVHADELEEIYKQSKTFHDHLTANPDIAEHFLQSQNAKESADQYIAEHLSKIVSPTGEVTLNPGEVISEKKAVIQAENEHIQEQLKHENPLPEPKPGHETTSGQELKPPGSTAPEAQLGPEGKGSEVKPVDGGTKGQGNVPPKRPTELPTSPTGEPAYAHTQADLNQRRVAREESPIEKKAQESDPEAWAKAIDIETKDKGYGQRLIEKLEKTPTAVNKVDQNVIFRELIKADEEFKAADQAVQDATPEQKTDAEDRAQRALEWTRRVEQVDHDVAGSIVGASLQARRMRAVDAMSLTSIERRIRTEDNDGKPLSKEQQKEAETLYKKENNARKLQEEKDRQKQQALDEHYFNQLIKGIKQTTKESKKAGKSLAEHFAEISKAADERLTKRRTSTKLFALGDIYKFDPRFISDVAIREAFSVGSKAIEKAEFFSKLIKEFTNKITPHMEEIWNKAHKFYDEQKAVFEKENPRVAAKEEKPLSREDKKLGRKIYDIRKEKFNEGVTDREANLKAVTEEVKKDIPSITEKEVSDAFSGYGKERHPSNISEDRAALREWRKVEKLNSQIAALEKGELPKKNETKKSEPSEKVKSLTKQRDALVEELGGDQQLARDKANIRKSIEKLQERIRNNDYEPVPKKVKKLDAELAAIQHEQQKVRDEFNNNREKARQAKLTPESRGLSWYAKARRAGFLTGAKIFGKLFSAGGTRLASIVAEQTVAGILSKIPGFKYITSRSPRYHGFSIGALMKLPGGFIQGIKNAPEILRGNRVSTETDLLQPDTHGPKSILDYPARGHAVMKSPFKESERSVSLESRKEHAKLLGDDPNSPATEREIKEKAHQDAMRAIFMNDNAISKAFEYGLKVVEKGKTLSGRGGAEFARLARFLLPIVKVPTNIAIEAHVLAGGTISGSYKLAQVMARSLRTGGKEGMTGDEADMIIRHLSKGMIGVGLFLIGYNDSKNMGGFYIDGEKRKPGSVPAESIKIHGVTIPPWLLHSPAFMVIQAGATARRLAEEGVKGEKIGLPLGVLRTEWALLNNLPFINEMGRLDKLFATNSAGSRARGNFVSGLYEPQLVKEIAEVTDPLSKNRYRAPQTFGQTIKTGIPGLREQVPSKPKK